MWNPKQRQISAGIYPEQGRGAGMTKYEYD